MKAGTREGSRALLPKDVPRVLVRRQWKMVNLGLCVVNGLGRDQG